MMYLVLLCVVKTLVGNECRYRYVILMTVTKMANKGQIPLRYLVADRSEAGRRPAANWNLAYHLAR